MGAIGTKCAFYCDALYCNILALRGLIPPQHNWGNRMQHIINIIAERPLARALLLVLFGTPIVLFTVLDAPQRSSLALHAIYWAGFFTPAVAAAAAIGFLTWNQRVWWMSLAIGLGLTGALIVLAMKGGWSPGS
jgi:hypothetical protein